MKIESMEVTGDQMKILNDVSRMVCKELARGMPADELISLGMTVFADYARAALGDDYLDELAELIVLRKGDPLPPHISMN